MLSTLENLKIGSDFLLDFKVADVSFSLVVCERYVCQKSKTMPRIALTCMSIEQILTLGIFGLSSSFLRGLRLLSIRQLADLLKLLQSGFSFGFINDSVPHLLVKSEDKLMHFGGPLKNILSDLLLDYQKGVVHTSV